MNSYVLLIAIFLPILGGILPGVIPFKGRTTRNIFVETVVIITSIIMFSTEYVLNKPVLADVRSSRPFPEFPNMP